MWWRFNFLRLLNKLDEISTFFRSAYKIFTISVENRCKHFENLYNFIIMRSTRFDRKVSSKFTFYVPFSNCHKYWKRKFPAVRYLIFILLYFKRMNCIIIFINTTEKIYKILMKFRCTRTVKMSSLIHLSTCSFSYAYSVTDILCIIFAFFICMGSLLIVLRMNSSKY